MRFLWAWFLIVFSLPAFAWNATGHRIAAAVTYDHLSPQARARVDELLRHHPDYDLLIRDSPPDPEARARAAFLAAAVWPDTIRGDKRFYNDTAKDAQPTPLLPGFPDMQRHTNWHYIDVPITPDGVHKSLEPPPNALSELERLLKIVATPVEDSANPSYALPWILHISEDLHQPLHTVSRFLKSQPMGDAGGNNVYFLPEGVPSNRRLFRTLHSIWDDSGGTDPSDSNVNRTANEITMEYLATYGSTARFDTDPHHWVKQGVRLARKSVYTFGLVTGTRENPLPVPPDYESRARRIARVQMAAAGLRMAAILNDLWR
jgi:hypothetical protein